MIQLPEHLIDQDESPFDLAAKAKPVLKWAGGKAGLLSQLIPHFPVKLERYMEPFVGGASLFLALRKHTPAIINDANSELWNLYNVLKLSPRQLMTALDGLFEQYSEDFYYELRTQAFDDPIQKAARTVFLNKTGFNGLYRQNSKGYFNVPFGKRVKCPQLYDKNNILTVSDRLQKAEILNLDFEALLERAGAGDFVYCDPPYEPLSATASFNSYTSGGFSRAAQVRLKEACERAASRGAFIALSNSSADFILELYKDWEIKYIRARRAINSKGEKRGSVDEILALIG